MFMSEIYIKGNIMSLEIALQQKLKEMEDFLKIFDLLMSSLYACMAIKDYYKASELTYAIDEVINIMLEGEEDGTITAFQGIERGNIKKGISKSERTNRKSA